MRDPILPPPPPTRVAVWAALNAIWFRAAAAVRARIAARVAAAVRASRRRRARLPEAEPTRAPAFARPRLELPPAQRAREERSTVVERRRVG